MSGGGYSGTYTVTAIGGFEWSSQLETPQGPRSLSGNDPG